jgi:UDP-GlcNAc:undecaprenyl-phosphate GlcNAc-1-phosphate transferase
MVAAVLVLGGLACGLSWLACGLVRRGSLRLGLVDGAGREAHKPMRPGGAVPNTGGVGVFTAIAWPMVAVLLGVWLIPESAWAAGFDRLGVESDVLTRHLEGLRQTSGIGGGILAGLAAVHVLGLYDDRRALGPWSKLGVQVAVAAGLVGWCDIRVLSFLAEGALNLPAGVGWSAMFLVSLLWIVVMTNALNFLDNMDGLAAGVGLVAGGLYLAATLLGGQWFVAGLAALLCGSLLGFLWFNLPPARLYLGDGGSLVVGLLLAVIAVRTTYVDLDLAEPGGASTFSGGAWYGVLMPVLVLAVPLYDFTSVTLIRLSRGQSPFHGDHNHFSHRLLRRGLTRRMALAVILLATLATGLGGVMLGRLEGWQAALVATQAAAVLAMLGLLEWSRR